MSIFDHLLEKKAIIISDTTSVKVEDCDIATFEKVKQREYLERKQTSTILSLLLLKDLVNIIVDDYVFCLQRQQERQQPINLLLDNLEETLCSNLGGLGGLKFAAIRHSVANSDAANSDAANSDAFDLHPLINGEPLRLLVPIECATLTDKIIGEISISQMLLRYMGIHQDWIARLCENFKTLLTVDKLWFPNFINYRICGVDQNRHMPGYDREKNTWINNIRFNIDISPTEYNTCTLLKWHERHLNMFPLVLDKIIVNVDTLSLTLVFIIAGPLCHTDPKSMAIMHNE